LVDQLSDLLCVNIEFRCTELKLNDFQLLLDSFKNSVLESVVIRMDYSNYCTDEFIQKVIKQRSRIKHVYLYNSPLNNEGEQHTFIKDIADYINDCGYVYKDNFTINQPFFFEGQSCNTCLNKKATIDFDGNIKNCPAMNLTCGNVKEDKIKDVITTSEFQEMWNITKDQIEVCKDCEYRYMCLDCRAFVDNPDNMYSHPSRCNYNPYIAKWKGEEGFQSVADCGIDSNEKTFSIDHDRVKSINTVLWDE
jgi:SPASM domain peptide maturase of grasp-with-spasm system